MEKLKLYINTILLYVTGYQLAQLDRSGYTYREDLYTAVAKSYGSRIRGKILDTGAHYNSWAKETFGTTAEVITIDQQKGAADITGDLLALPFPDNTFDCIFCFETIEHVTNPFTAVAEMKRVLKPGGLLIGSTPFGYDLHGEEYGDYWRITRQGWEHLLNDFKQVEIHPFGVNTLRPHHYLFKGVK